MHKLLCLTWSLIGCIALTARPLERTKTWENLSPEVTNVFISLTLPDGTRLRGLGRGVHSDVLILDVRRSSNHRLHPRRRGTQIPRAGVSIIDVYLRHRSAGNPAEAIGFTVGVVAVTPLAYYLGETNKGGLGIAVWVAGAVAGAYIGHHFFNRDPVDESHVRITVAPPPAPRVP